jgi:hypothetical protein
MLKDEFEKKNNQKKGKIIESTHQTCGSSHETKITL